MMPSMGGIVFYHFEHILEDGTAVLQARPAIVVDANTDGVCELHVFFSIGDRAFSQASLGPDDADRTRYRLDVQPHLEHAGEIGRVERKPPMPNTWSWPPWGTWPRLPRL